MCRALVNNQLAFPVASELMEAFKPQRDELNEVTVAMRLTSRMLSAWLPLELGYNRVVSAPALIPLLNNTKRFLEDEFDLAHPEDLKNFMALSDV